MVLGTGRAGKYGCMGIYSPQNEQHDSGWTKSDFPSRKCKSRNRFIKAKSERTESDYRKSFRESICFCTIVITGERSSVNGRIVQVGRSVSDCSENTFWSPS